MDATALAAELLGAVPANATLGIRVESAVDGHGTVSMDVPQRLTNVIGSLHASGLAGLVDASGLAAIISAMSSPIEVRGLLPLGRTARLSFLAPARGLLSAGCELADDARHALAGLQPGGTVRLTTSTTITSGSDVVCEGEFDWSVRRTG